MAQDVFDERLAICLADDVPLGKAIAIARKEQTDVDRRREKACKESDK